MKLMQLLVNLIYLHDYCILFFLKITFKVSWNEEETTLKKFKDFLTMAFKSHEIFIRLRVVHQCPLKFFCSIPNCLKEEIADYVTKEKDHLISEGVVEVTIESDVIFNVVCTKCNLI